MNISQVEQGLSLISSKHDSTRGRQLIFWYDTAAEFADDIEALTLPDGFEKIVLAGNPFAVKYKLLVKKPNTSFLVYIPAPEPPAHKNWLLDLQNQASVYSADRATLLLQQYGFQNRSLHNYIKEHLPFFNAKKRSNALSVIGLAKDCTEMELRTAMMCVLANLRVIDAGQLIREVLKQGLTEDENELWQELFKFFTPEEFWQVVEHELGISLPSSGLRELFIRLALTHLQHSLNTALPDNLSSKVAVPGIKPYVFVDSWLRHSVDAPRWAELSQLIAPDLSIDELANSLDPSVYLEVETFAAFDRELIKTIVDALVSGTNNTVSMKSWISDRKALFWYEKCLDYYEALEAAVEFTGFWEQYVHQYSGEAEALFKGYANLYYQIDLAYRQYIEASDRVTGDVLKDLTEKIERLYTQNLESLGEAWSKAIEKFDGSWAVPVQKQWWFYSHHVETVLQRSEREKIFVLISDALRYEIAAELQASLVADLRGEATLTPLVGVLPSITKIGMAALLPHKALSITDKGEVLADGLSTQGMVAREGVLSSSGISSVVLKASDLVAMSRDEGRNAVQPHRVIYIYQDRIDAVGDKPASERQVFAACKDVINELNTLVRKIANQLNGSNILITSDHGFLYQRQPLSQPDKVERTSGGVIDTGRRHALGRDLKQGAGTQTFSSLPYLEDKNLQVQSPWGTLRYAVQGGGAQFVHGGASLQEICVPLITYKHVRASKGDDGPSRKVGVSVSTSVRKVTNNIFTLNFIQDEPVSDRVRPREVLIKFVDQEGVAVTNSYPLNLDSAATQATEREHRVRLTIGRSDLDQNKPYYLVIIDAEDDLEILREQWQISLAFTDDFGDF